jgi:hypothetical protein
VCGAIIEIALRRRLAGVYAVSISQQAQTVAVTFRPGTRVFSAAAFREAVAEPDVEVLSIELDACGVAEGNNDLQSLRIGDQFLLRLRDASAAAGSRICVEGRLDDGVEPNVLHAKTVRPWK